jgi:hypothetical protein
MDETEENKRENKIKGESEKENVSIVFPNEISGTKYTGTEIRGTKGKQKKTERK